MKTNKRVFILTLIGKAVAYGSLVILMAEYTGRPFLVVMIALCLATLEFINRLRKIRGGEWGE